MLVLWISANLVLLNLRALQHKIWKLNLHFWHLVICIYVTTGVQEGNDCPFSDCGIHAQEDATRLSGERPAWTHWGAIRHCPSVFSGAWSLVCTRAVYGSSGTQWHWEIIFTSGASIMLDVPNVSQSRVLCNIVIPTSEMWKFDSWPFPANYISEMSLMLSWMLNSCKQVRMF